MGSQRPFVDLAADGPFERRQGLAQLGLDLGDLDGKLEHLALGGEDRPKIDGLVLVARLGEGLPSSQRFFLKSPSTRSAWSKRHQESPNNLCRPTYQRSVGIEKLRLSGRSCPL
jgi:hypothetical protein